MRFLAVLLASVAAAAALPGEFELSRDGNAWRLQLTRADTVVDGRRVIRLAATELEGFDPALPNGSAARFRLKRDAGLFEFNGTLANGGATGRFDFTPDPAFSTRMRAAGLRNWWEPGVAFDYAATGKLPTPALQRPPPQSPPPAARLDERLGTLRVHGVTSEYLRLLRQAGYDSLSDNQLIELRSRGVNTLDLQELQMRGHRNLSVDEIVKLKNDGFRQ